MWPKQAINKGVIPALARNLAEETGGSLILAGGDREDLEGP